MHPFWAFGVVLLALVMGRRPTESARHDEQVSTSCGHLTGNNLEHVSNEREHEASVKHLSLGKSKYIMHQTWNSREPTHH
jgi:hypothetical protein